MGLITMWRGRPPLRGGCLNLRPEVRVTVFADRLTVAEVDEEVGACLAPLSQWKGEANRKGWGVEVRWLWKRGKTLEYMPKGADRQMSGGPQVLAALLQSETQALRQL